MANTYRWNCPRCGHSLMMSSPSAPSNCPRCNFPDGPVSREDAALEAEVGPEAALTMTEEQAQQGQSLGLRPGDTFSTAPAQQAETPKFEAGWLGECMHEVVEPYMRKMIEGEGERGMAEKGYDWVGLAEGVIERYYGDRPRLICGCLAGEHLKDMASITEAHKDRIL